MEEGAGVRHQVAALAAALAAEEELEAGGRTQ
jgi:hypothetical protein